MTMTYCETAEIADRGLSKAELDIIEKWFQMNDKKTIMICLND